MGILLRDAKGRSIESLPKKRETKNLGPFKPTPLNNRQHPDCGYRKVCPTQKKRDKFRG